MLYDIAVNVNHPSLTVVLLLGGHMLYDIAVNVNHPSLTVVLLLGGHMFSH